MEITGIDITAFVVSCINFSVAAYLFYKVVIQPMQDAVRVRGERVQKRLDEAESVMTEARETEATYKAQFARLEAEVAEMRASNQKEVARISKSLTESAQADALHLVDKAGREAEKMRQNTLAELQHKVSVQVMAAVEPMLKKALAEADVQSDMATTFLAKVGTFSAS